MALFMFRNSAPFLMFLFLFALSTADAMAVQGSGQTVGQMNKDELLSFADSLYDEKD